MGEFDYTNQSTINEENDRTYNRPVGAVYPTFFIGVGGCGCEIIQKIKTMLSNRPDYKDRYSKLVQFIAIDTDMDDLKELDLKYKFLISDFPKGEYIKVKTGQEYKEADPFFMQWWPRWYQGRPDSTKGAGQIRLESRLSLAYQLEMDRGGLIEQFNDAIVRAKDHDNPFRMVRPPLAYCHIFGSVAGGTGSGGFLTLAYLFQELLKNHQLSPVMVGHFLLPTLFYRKVRTRLHDDIRANGYAALKELEWFMSLSYNNNPRMMRGDHAHAEEDYLEFHYNPNRQGENENQQVTMPPFHLVNIIDEPGDFSFAEPKDIYPAVAGCAYIQLFSPIIGQRESEEDNYYKKIKHLENGFSQNYGTYGLSMLVLPDRDILGYCENMMMKGLLELITGKWGSGEKQKDQDYIQEIINVARAEIRGCADPEEIEDLPTIKLFLQAGLLGEFLEQLKIKGADTNESAREINERLVALSNKDTGMYPIVKRFVDTTLGGLDETIEDNLPAKKPTFSNQDLPETADNQRATIQAKIETLADRLGEMIRNNRKSIEQEFKGLTDYSGLMDELDKFIPEDGTPPNPIARRMAMIQAQDYIQKKKRGMPDEGAADFDSGGATLRAKLDQIYKCWGFTGLDRIRATLPKGWIWGEDDWTKCRNDSIPAWYFLDLEQAREGLASEFGRRFIKGCKSWIEKDLERLKRLDAPINGILQGLDDAIKKALQASGGMSDEFILDDEVFTGVRTRTRHWDRLFNWLVKVKVPELRLEGESVDIGYEVCADEGGKKEIMRPKISTAIALQQELMLEIGRLLQADRDRPGAVVAKDPSTKRLEATILSTARRFCRRNLVPMILGKRQAGDARKDKGLMIDECLELEARWELEELFIRDHLVNYSTEIHEGVPLISQEEEAQRRVDLIEQFEPSAANIEEYIREKISFVADKARNFARLRLTETNAVDPFTFICMHEGHYTKKSDLAGGFIGDKDLTLGSFIKDSHPRFRTSRLLDGWTDEKRIAFFNAQSGLPIHNFYPVNDELKKAYELIYREYVTGNDPKQDPLKDFPSHVDKNFEDPHNWDPHEALPDLHPARKIGKRRRGLEQFMRLVAYGVIHKKSRKDLSLDSADEMTLDVKNSWTAAVKSEHIKEKGAQEFWVIGGTPPTTPLDADPVLFEERREFTEVLGDRLDRAYDRYQHHFWTARANRAKTDHLEELITQKIRIEEEKENPNAFIEELKGHLKILRGERDENLVLRDKGYRVRDYLHFLESAIECLKAVYKDFQGSELSE